MRKTNKFSSIGLWIAIGLFIGMVGLIELAVVYERSGLRSQQYKAMNSDLVELRSLLSSELNAAVYFTLGLKAYIVGNDGVVKEQEMGLWLTNLHSRANHIRNIGMAPGNRITYIYPREGNEAALGLYYPDVPAQWASVQEVINSKQAKLVGPIELKQGGLGLVYREPVFLSDGTYWGVISTVINADSLFATLSEAAKRKGLGVAIVDKDTQKTLVEFSLEQQHSMSSELAVSLPGRNLVMTGATYLEPLSAWLMALRVGGWLVALLLAFLLVRFLRSIQERAQAKQELHESQLQFARAFSASPQGIALVDDKGNWVQINASFCSMLGADPDYFTNKRVEEIFEPGIQPFVKEKMEELINDYASKDVHGWQCEAGLMMATGDTFMGLVSLSICFRHHDEAQWILQVIDISERIRLEQLKNDFVSTVSHELRTPLTSILGGLKLLLSGQLGAFEPNAKKILTIATKNSERLMELINDILDMDKLIANKMEFNCQLQDLTPIIQFSVESNQAYAAQYGVNFLFEPPAEPVCVLVDSLRLQQVINNFLSNAAKFSPANSVVDISLQLSSDRVRISIKDSGEGISVEDQQKLFKKFSQVDSSSTRKKGGTGLGLAISKELIERMNGTIGVHSVVGEGACFYVELKREECDAVQSSSE
ncbi:MAG: CHASE domain-containing protein [Cellvibrio sp.]|nr:CHASE domain-containing protein [Cellvibrio sp.]